MSATVHEPAALTVLPDLAESPAGHQFVGGSLAGNDCRPHSSTMSSMNHALPAAADEPWSS